MDLSTATFGDSSNRCPYPGCPKPSLCRPHLALVPESLLDTFDMRAITKYFRIRLRLHRLSTGAAPSTNAGLERDAAPLRHPGDDSAALRGERTITQVPSRVAALSPLAIELNWSLTDFLSRNPKWFIAIWVALIAFSLRLVWEYTKGGSDA